MDADRLCQYIEVGKTDECSPNRLVPLLGIFKGEYEYWMHVFPIEIFFSGIHIWRWVERLVNILRVDSKYNCPAFHDEDGFQLYAAVLESVMHPVLKRMQVNKYHKDNIVKDLEVD